MRTGRKSLRGLIILSAGVGCAGVLIAVALPLRDWIVEGSKLRTVEKGPPEEQARALAWLLERGSMRAVPHLLDQILDPALERHLEATVEAIHALRLERSGGTDTEEPPHQLRPRSEERVNFVGVDRDTLDFLRSPSLRPAVQFSCALPWAPYDEALEDALEHGKLAVRAQALAVLLRVKAPASVNAQWSTLEALQQSALPGDWRPVLARMASSFEASPLLAELTATPPASEFGDPPARFEWSVRAAGVTRLGGALPRLRELSVSGNLHTSLAAERSLEDFEGPEADEALGFCLLGWKYDAYVRAGSVLAERNKRYLKQILSNIAAPPKCRYWQAILLARAGSVEAVPLLVSEVHKMDMIDREMFEHIGRLAQPRHRDLIESLPGLVRPDQADDARAAVSRFEERFPPEERSP